MTETSSWICGSPAFSTISLVSYTKVNRQFGVEENNVLLLNLIYSVSFSLSFVLFLFVSHTQTAMEVTRLYPKIGQTNLI